MYIIDFQKNHYHELPANVKEALGDLPDGYLSYFETQFPGMFMHVYKCVESCEVRAEPLFKQYFESY